MQTLTVYCIYAGLLIALAYVVFRIVVRREYIKRGQLTPLSALLEFLVWTSYFVFPYVYNPADWGWFWSYRSTVSPLVFGVGVIFIVGGVVAVLASMAYLGFRRSMGQEPDLLRQSGPYRFTRNPQIVACLPFAIGYVVLEPSWYAIGWLALFAVVAHLMVVTEEEHLTEKHGEAFVRYCEQVPRYLGIPLRPDPSKASR